MKVKKFMGLIFLLSVIVLSSAPASDAEPFEFLGLSRRMVTTDNKSFVCIFSKPLSFKQTQYYKAKVFRVKNADGSACHTRLNTYASIDYTFLKLEIDDPVEACQELIVYIDKGFMDNNGTTLAEDVQARLTVCSSTNPSIKIEDNLGVPRFVSSGIDSYQLKFYEFNDDVIEHLDPPFQTGMMSSGSALPPLIQRTITQTIRPTTEQQETQSPYDLLKDFPNGFWGVTVEKFKPLNACNDFFTWMKCVYMTPTFHLFHIQDIDFILRSTTNESLLWVYYRKDYSPVIGALVNFHSGNSNRNLGKTDKNGFLHLHENIHMNENERLEVVNPQNSKDKAFLRHSGTNRSRINDRNNEIEKKKSIPNLAITCFLDKQDYLPGETVYISGVVKELKKDHLMTPLPIPDKQDPIHIEIRSENDTLIANADLHPDRFGGYSHPFKTSPNIENGDYYVEISYLKYATESSRFTIGFFQPDTMAVSINGLKKSYMLEDTLDAVISGQYLSGNPMANDDLEYALKEGTYINNSDLFAADKIKKNKLDIYEFSLHNDFIKTEEPQNIIARFDATGKHHLSYPLKKLSKNNAIRLVTLDATAKSAEGKEFTSRADFALLPGNRMTGICIPKWFPFSEPIKIDLVMVDKKGDLVQGKVDVTVFRLNVENNKNSYHIIQSYPDVSVHQRRQLQLKFLETGYYVIRCDTRDEYNRMVSTSERLYYSGWHYLNYSDIIIQTEREKYHPGEIAKIIVTTKRKGRVILTVESNNILAYETFDLNQETGYNIKVLPHFYPRVRINVTALFPGEVTKSYDTYFDVEIPHSPLNIAIDCQKELKPDSKSTVHFKVTDKNGKGQKSGLFVYAMDEGQLSLGDYEPLNFYYHFYQYFLYNSYDYSYPRTSFSHGNYYWKFLHPNLDIPIDEHGYFGRVTASDGTPMADVTVAIQNEIGETLWTTSTSPAGYYYTTVPPSHIEFTIKCFKEGYHSPRFLLPKHISPETLSFNNKKWSSHFFPNEINHILITAAEYDAYLISRPLRDDYAFDFSQYNEYSSQPLDLGRVRQDINEYAPRVDARKSATAVSISPQVTVRESFLPLLFYKKIETDDQGNATIDFITSQLLTTYRIIAIAYNEDNFGNGSRPVRVSKDLLLEETMPEFARLGDSFQAGVRLANRMSKKTTVSVQAESTSPHLHISGTTNQLVEVPAKSNLPIHFQFEAVATGDAAIRYIARSDQGKKEETDGLLKKLPILPNLLNETLLEIEWGKKIDKTIPPAPAALSRHLKLKVSPYIIEPAIKIAEKLIFYPYDCMEQRLSKALPYLALNPQFYKLLGLNPEHQQIKDSLTKLIGEMPEYVSENSALAYYRTGNRTSEYLTTYGLWFLRLAQKRGFQVPEVLIEKMENYLHSIMSPTPSKTTNAFNPFNSYQQNSNSCFFQYLLSIEKKASQSELNRLFAERNNLSTVNLAFLLRAIHIQLNDTAKTNSLLMVLEKRMNTIIAEHTFFQFLSKTINDIWNWRYQDMPFYSERYEASVILQAILEVKGQFNDTNRILNWLIHVDSREWRTTQTNFWILYAIDFYVASMETTQNQTVALTLEGQTHQKQFTGFQDVLEIEKNLTAPVSPSSQPLEITLTSDKPVYLTTQTTAQLENPEARSHGIQITRNIYNQSGQPVTEFKRGEIYQVELLFDAAEEIPFAVVNAPVPAGFEMLRQEFNSTRQVEEYNNEQLKNYQNIWGEKHHAVDGVVIYTYRLYKKSRLFFFIKAMYKGSFTWFPTTAESMYHPQSYGRTGTLKIAVTE